MDRGMDRGIDRRVYWDWAWDGHGVDREWKPQPGCARSVVSSDP
jgi:hypothetical protein